MNEYRVTLSLRSRFRTKTKNRYIKKQQHNPKNIDKFIVTIEFESRVDETAADRSIGRVDGRLLAIIEGIEDSNELLLEVGVNDTFDNDGDSVDRSS